MTAMKTKARQKLPGNSISGWQKGCVAGCFVAILLATSSLQAGLITVPPIPITVPSDLNPGDPYRLAFVTSTTRDATSTNIADYNNFVSGVANGVTQLAALGTTWKAIGSTSADDARDNTGTKAPSQRR